MNIIPSLIFDHQEEEEDDTKYVPVGFIENPYYDDHFDLPTDAMRLGKTLVMITKGHNDLMGNSYRLLGWAHYEKFDRGLEQLKEVVEKEENASLAQEAVSTFLSACLLLFLFLSPNSNSVH